MVFLQEMICAFMLYRAYAFFYPKVQKNVYENTQDDVIAVGEQKKPIISADTVLVFEDANLSTGEYDSHTEIISEKYMGMDRDAFQKELDIMKAAPSLEEKKKGFYDLELSSFSGERVVVKKYYKLTESEGCYLVVRNHLVSVYKEDKITPLQETNILLFHLPIQLQMEIIQCKHVENQRELYDFLETYTS